MSAGCTSTTAYSRRQKRRADISRVTKGLDDITIIGSGGNINKLFRLSEKDGGT